MPLYEVLQLAGRDFSHVSKRQAKHRVDQQIFSIPRQNSHCSLVQSLAGHCRTCNGDCTIGAYLFVTFCPIAGETHQSSSSAFLAAMAQMAVASARLACCEDRIWPDFQDGRHIEDSACRHHEAILDV
eukprot:3576460-Amphidinium_carterae.1